MQKLIHSKPLRQTPEYPRAQIKLQNSVNDLLHVPSPSASPGTSNSRGPRTPMGPVNGTHVKQVGCVCLKRIQGFACVPQAKGRLKKILPFCFGHRFFFVDRGSRVVSLVDRLSAIVENIPLLGSKLYAPSEGGSHRGL